MEGAQCAPLIILYFDPGHQEYRLSLFFPVLFTLIVIIMLFFYF